MHLSAIQPERPLVLASTSPRRRSIMSAMGLAFSACSPQVDNEESYFRGADLDNAICRLAHDKAQSVTAHNPQSLVLGADTVVVCDNQVLGKPTDREHAFEMISMLAGRVHTVVTAVALTCSELEFNSSRIEKTDVRFRALEINEIEQYLLCDDYKDKAGAYGIQGAALTLVERIDGCYYNVVGLPVVATIHLLKTYQSTQGVSR